MTATLRPPSPPTANRPAPNPPGGTRPHPLRPLGASSAGGVGNFALAALTLASVVALSRLFTHPARFLVPVAVVAVAVHSAAWGCRRARLDLAPSALLCAVAAVVTTSWVALGHTTAYGVPWRGTYHALGPVLQAAADAYRTTSPPTAVITGFVVAGACGAAFAAFLGDWAAFRMRATTEACLPSFSLFVLSGALAQGHAVVLAGAVWLGALLTFLLVRQPPVDGPATAWFASRSRRGPATILVTGGVVAALVVGAVVVVGPRLPGATVHPAFNWRRAESGGAGRTTGSPLVDIKNRLHSESQQEVFTVATGHPTYWRLTALDTFQGSGWTLVDNYRPTGASLPAGASGSNALPPDAGPTTSASAIFAVSALDSLWLPAAYRPVRITGVHGVRYSAAAGSLIGTKATSDGLTYTVQSDVPAAGRAQLEGAAYLSPTAPALQKYLELPTSVPPTVRQIATAVTGGARSPYEAALALQNWLRGPLFRYSLDVPADDGQNALVDFLTRTRAGFCQQFAASFAVLAREVGLPSRVAVGFTPGTLESDGLYHVRDDDAHAWPEVYFAGIGWIAFEPTPGRGSPDPSAQSITGVPPQSPDAGRPSTTPATPPTSVANGAAGPSPASRARPRLDTGTPAAGAHHSGGSRLDLYVLAALAAGLLLWGAALAALQWGLVARRRRHARTPSQRIDVAWARAAEALTTARVPRRPWDTPREYAHRAARAAALPEAAADALAGLAAALSVAAYSPVSPSEADAASAEAAADLIAAAVAADRRWWERAVALVDPRPAWRMVAVRLPRPIARRLSPDA